MADQPALRRPPRAATSIWTVLCYAATAFGLVWLALILGALIWNGVGGLSLDVFTKMTAPPGVEGGLLNSIVGSLIQTAIGLRYLAPIGILAGTYLAEYGRHSKLSIVGALHQRHSAQRALDRRRPVRLPILRRAVRPFLGARRRRRARRHRGADHRAHHRGHAEPGAQHVARSGLARSACRARWSSATSPIAR